MYNTNICPKKAFVDAIVTSKTTMNTQVKGQHGYKTDNIFDKMSEAEKMYQQYKWIIKWENKWHKETQETSNHNYLKLWQGFFLDL